MEIVGSEELKFEGGKGEKEGDVDENNMSPTQ